MRDDPGAGVHDGVLAFARKRGLTVRPPATGSDRHTVELPKGELLIEVAFANGTQPQPGEIGAEEWFISARDPRTSQELWSNRFSYWEWFDQRGEAEEDLSDEEWFEGMTAQLIAFLDLVLSSEARLEQVARKPHVLLFGRAWQRGEKTTLQLRVEDRWVVWDKAPPLYSD